MAASLTQGNKADGCKWKTQKAKQQGFEYQAVGGKFVIWETLSPRIIIVSLNRKSPPEMTKERTNFISLVVLAGISFLVAILSFVNVSNRKLNKSQVTRGEVKEAFITERLVDGFKYKRPETVFCFRLFNSNQNFAVNFANGRYDQLERKIRMGDSIQVY